MQNLCLENDMRPIPVAKPIISRVEVDAVKAVLVSGMLAQGEVVREFEKSFSIYSSVSESVAVSNGTTALDLALKAIDIKAGDEVITTPFTFIATSNSILFQGAKPVFADIDEKTFNIDPNMILERITSKTRAVLGVHLFGQPFDVKALHDICVDHKLHLIEDCAQAHGAEYDGIKVGGFGVVGCFSFYPTKNMTSGEGGMITTNDMKIAETCRLLRSHGESKKYLHTLLGYNYRMTNIQAAIGSVQLKKLDEFNEKRIKNAGYFDKKITARGLVTPHKSNKVKHVYHQYVLKVGGEFPMSRDEFMVYLQKNGIGCAVHYPMPINKQPLYRQMGYSGDECPIASDMANRVLSIPVHSALTRDDLKQITNIINRVV